MLKDIDLTNKCGSCCHFKPIEDTTTGECLQNPYDDSVVHDPKHPHWIVQRSRIKCRLYNAKPQTNADRIRAMSDEELADWLARTQIDNVAEALKIACVPWEQHPDLQELTEKDCLGWLKQPAEVR